MATSGKLWGPCETTYGERTLSDRWKVMIDATDISLVSLAGPRDVASHRGHTA
jgi:hypothetical protein